MRLRRRGLASINAEVRDGILPAADAVALVPREGATGAGSVRNYRVVALIIACALFMEHRVAMT